MKKLTVLAVVLLSSVMVHAQHLDDRSVGIIEEITRSIIILFGMSLIGSFILIIFRQILDHRLKNRMLEKGASDELAAQFLRPDVKDVKKQTMKWFIIFLCIGAGFLFIDATQPIGLHSIAILCFCIALGYLAYYLFVRKMENK
jgi:L-cystine uptake protein TcyP (sodium:dicarboxylate symporter family)